MMVTVTAHCSSNTPPPKKITYLSNQYIFQYAIHSYGLYPLGTEALQSEVSAKLYQSITLLLQSVFAGNVIFRNIECEFGELVSNPSLVLISYKYPWERQNSLPPHELNSRLDRSLWLLFFFFF